MTDHCDETAVHESIDSIHKTSTYLQPILWLFLKPFLGVVVQPPFFFVSTQLYRYSNDSQNYYTPLACGVKYFFNKLDLFEHTTTVWPTTASINGVHNQLA